MTNTPPTPRTSSGFDAKTLTRVADLYSAALRAQVRQWQQAIEQLGAGRYGIRAAARDLGESTERALILSADLVGLWSSSLSLPGNDNALAASARRDHGRHPPRPPVDHEPPVDVTPEPAAPPASSPAPPPPRRKTGARHKAERFLTENLGAEERHSKELLRLAKAKGISESTLQRAKRRIGVRSRREGFGPDSRVFWHLPRNHR